MSKFVTFRQADSRWGSLPYSRAPYYMSDTGCGPTACASIIYNIKRDITPITTRAYMIRNGYCITGNGTAAAGITNCLKHYGYKVGVHYDMASFWKACDAGNVAGVIWFRKGTRGGVTWTTTGHYVAFSGYYKKNGYHYLYTRDPGGRHNDGWHCYETQMYGLIVELWTVNVPNNSTTTTTQTVDVTAYYRTNIVMNIRQGASTNYKIVGTIPKGVTIKTTKEHGNWVYVPNYNGKNGWVCVKDSSTTYLTKVAAPTSYTGTWPILPSRGYFKSGDRGTQVTRIQAFLNWYGNYKLATDGIYGPNTVNAVKKFQSAMRLTADGLWGKGTQAAAKAFRR